MIKLHCKESDKLLEATTLKSLSRICMVEKIENVRLKSDADFIPLVHNP